MGRYLRHFDSRIPPVVVVECDKCTRLIPMEQLHDGYCRDCRFYRKES
jgi:hypothetical protein